MVMQSRLVCYSKQTFPENAESRLLNYEEKDAKEKVVVTKIELFEPISFRRRSYIRGRIWHKVKREVSDFQVKNNKVIDAKKWILWDRYVTFFLQQKGNLVLFSHKDEAFGFGIEKLARALFDDSNIIEGVEFDLAKIEEAKGNGEFQNLWTHGYKKSGNIHSRMESGNDIDSDLEFKGCDEVDKSYVGITTFYDGKNMKIKVFKSGCVHYFRSWGMSRQETHHLFNIVFTFLPYCRSRIIE